MSHGCGQRTRLLHCSGKVRDGCGIDSARDWNIVKGVLGYKAYPGTLNLRLSHRLPDIEGVKIFDDFFECIPAKVGGVDCHVCGKYKLQNRRIVFVIAPVHLRSELGVNSGDDVEVLL